ncbi:hypothetical protein [Paenibacillus sp. Mc5Re-14]|uniref:hypothetical protein n=1 Tax=Paenibacillus sp. Mc5Re-14 TaxID=1030529 RepID=UPI000ABBB41A|nr:hypothetical protein [Paenibacillus sp. Mc5Re-14]
MRLNELDIEGKHVAEITFVDLHSNKTVLHLRTLKAIDVEIKKNEVRTYGEIDI